MANIVKAENASGSPEERVRDLLKDRVKLSGERNAGHMRLLRKFWRYYLTSSDRRGWWRKENDRDPGSGVEWRADMFVPASFSVIETAVPRAVFALFGMRPYVKVAGRERSDIEGAKAVEAMLDYDFEQAKMVQHAVEFFKSFYIFGTAVGRVDYWRDFYEIKHPPTWTVEPTFDEEGEIIDAKPRKMPDRERVVRYDGPRFQNVSLFDFFPDPYFDNIEDMRFVAEREETTIDRLKAENERYKDVTGKNLYKNIDQISPFKESRMSDYGAAEDFRQDTAEVFRFDFGFHGPRDKEQFKKDFVVLYRYWEDDRYVVMANGHTILRDGENPYNDKRKPYVAATCFPTLKEFYGQGLLAPIQYLQEELNTLRNIALDQGKLNLYGIWAIDEHVTLSDADLAVYPGKTIQTEFQGGKPAIAQVFDNTLSTDYERLENRCQRDIQSALAINDYMIGAGSGSAGTASEAAMLNASAANRFRLQALIAQDNFVVEVADMFLSRRQQHLDEKQTFRILGEQGYEYPEIGPEEIAGRYDFTPVGSQAQPNKEVLRQQMIQLLAVAGGNPILAGMTNWGETYKELWSLFDFRHPQRFLLPPPEKQVPQHQENMIILQGEKVAVDPNENHEEHIGVLMQAMPDVLASGDPRVQEAFQDHHDQHSRYLQATGQSGRANPAGAPRGEPGNQPNLQDATPSLPGMQAQVMGGPGGPIA